MYSKYLSSYGDKKYQVPEHYSGCAFAQPKKEEIRRDAEPTHPVPLPKTKISPQYPSHSSYASVNPSATPAANSPKERLTLPQERSPSIEASEKEPMAEEKPKEKQVGTLSDSFGQLLSRIGIGLPFSHGIDVDSLLLLGLILLLAGDGGDTELLLLLTLLLFCG